MVSITDHNSMALDVYKEFLSRDSPIRLLPGVEVDAFLDEGEASKHIIVYFDAVDDEEGIVKVADWVNDALGEVSPKSPINIDVLLNKLLELGIPFVLSPHAMKQNKRGIDFDWYCLENPGGEARKYIDQFFCLWETGGKSSIAHAVEFLREIDTDERVSIISSSDSKDFDKLDKYLSCPPQYFHALPSFRGLQMVGSEVNRISCTREEVPDESLGSYLGEVCFNGQKIELSTRLNAVIGGRGSGKSLLLDAIALALGDPSKKVKRGRREFVNSYAVSIKNAHGDDIKSGAFAYDYFNQSYVAKLFMEEGEAYKNTLKNYFQTGFDAVSEIDEAAIKAENMADFNLPIPDCSAGQLVADTPIVARTRFAGPCFPEVRGKSKTAEHNAFLGTKPQVAEGQNRGLVGSSRFFPALPEAPAGSIRQIPEPPSTPPLSHKETDGQRNSKQGSGRQCSDFPRTSGFSASLT